MMFVFFFKQKTAYEVRISDWSSDVCSSDLLMAGGVLAALGASSCCILPLVLFSIGVSGAWIGNLNALAPYQPLFAFAALVILAVGFWRVYSQPKVDRSEEHTSELQSLMRISYAVLCLHKT